MNIPHSDARRPEALILHNARIITLDPTRPRATALAIMSGRIHALGDVETFSLPSFRVSRIDMHAAVLMPGLVDAHLHLEHYARGLDRVRCDAATLQGCLERLRAHRPASPAGSWLLGHGWDQNKWIRTGNAADLDQLYPTQPVYLTAKSLHAAWANSAALRLAGIEANTPDPPGGRIERLSDGKPSGILYEQAMRLVSEKIPDPTPEQLVAALLRAQDELWRLGLTGVHDFDGRNCLNALLRLHEQGQLGLRVLKNVPQALLGALEDLGLRSGFGDEWIRLGGVKLFADGALGPRTAAMLDPYLEEPENTGMLLIDAEGVIETGLRAMRAGFPLTVHAIGDRANHEVLNAYEALRRHEINLGLPAGRHRIEHVQLIHPNDAHRLAQLDVIASMQPMHAISDRQMAERYWGARVNSAYAWNSQLQAGARLAFGSDAPVEEPDPWLGIHAAVTRRPADATSDAWIPDERISRLEALRGYTLGPAFAAGLENRQGMLRPGYWADLIVTDIDPLACTEAMLPQIRPLGVMVGGKWRWRLDQASGLSGMDNPL
jgi:predicted amidohydrolase YtcJ